MQRLEFRAMGCQMLAVLDSDRPEHARALDPVSGWFEEWEQALSRFRADSELNRLNGAGGRAMRVSDVLWQVIEQARAAAQASGGIVTATILPALEAAGYDRSFELVASQARAGAGGRVGDWRRIECDPRQRTVRLPGEMRLDLGGIAKGWAADRAAQRLSAWGPALVDASGDVAVSGPAANGGAWPIGVTDPFHPEHDLAVVALYSGAVATSGRDYRRWQANGKLQHHLIDPRTGRPAETDVLTATVIAPTAVEAEMAAKVALLRGSLSGRRWLDERPQLAGLLTLEDGMVIVTERMQNFMHEGFDYVTQ